MVRTLVGKFAFLLAAVAASLCFFGAPVLAAAAPAPGGAQRYVQETPDGQLTVGFTPGAVRPASAFGCNQDVCIQILGSGTHVVQWNTFAFNSGPVCTFPRWERPWGTIKVGRTICANQAGVFYAYWTPNSTFRPGQACNQWTFLPGRPCEQIER